MKLLQQFLLEAAGWDYDEFMKVWAAAPDRETVARHFKITPAHASARAMHLRSLGYELKKHQRGRKTGVSIPRPELGGKIPPREEFIRMWKENPSFTALSTKLGVPTSVVRQLLNKLSDEGVSLPAVATRGRKKKIDLDARTLAQIWEASTDLDEVIEKVQDMGFEMPATDLRKHLTVMAFRINKVRRAQGIPDLKKFARPYNKQIEFPSAPTQDVSLDDVSFDDGDSLADFLSDTKGNERDEDHDTEDLPTIVPQDDTDDIQQQSQDDVESMQSDGEREFIEIWNAADSFREMMSDLKAAGWELSKDDIKAKALELKRSGVDLKRFT